MAGRELHGEITDNPILMALLEAGNRARYGVSEEERMEMTNRLQAPGVEEVAYQGPHKIYDPAAAERYTSAYLFSKRWPKLTGPAKLATRLFRGAGSALGVPGMGEERAALLEAMNRGMARGSSEAPRGRLMLRRR